MRELPRSLRCFSAVCEIFHFPCSSQFCCRGKEGFINMHPCHLYHLYSKKNIIDPHIHHIVLPFCFSISPSPKSLAWSPVEQLSPWGNTCILGWPTRMVPRRNGSDSCWGTRARTTGRLGSQPKKLFKRNGCWKKGLPKFTSNLREVSWMMCFLFLKW